VRGLSERFGNERVFAIMGNHEVNLLVDRGAPDGQRYLNYAYAASHPSQYLEWAPPPPGLELFYTITVYYYIILLYYYTTILL
jgi:hypothetical protein